MAGQSVTFDFLSRGAATVAGDFRKVGDNAALASRGAKILSEVIGKLGDKESRTAAESVLLAKALRQTGEAEDRVTARAVLADASIRRLGDSMQDSQKKSDGLGKSLSGLKLNPGLVGPLLALAPAIATLGGVGAGAAAGLGGAFIAGGAALAAFGAVAKPVLGDAQKAAQAVEKAQDNYNIAIANGVKPAAAFKAEQIAIGKAYAGMSPQQVALSKQLGDMAGAWDKVKAAQTPVVSGALQPWLRSVTDLTKNLGPIIAKIAPVIQGLGAQFGSLVNSSAFKGFRDFVGSTGAAAVSAGGSTIIDLVKSFMILLPKFDPLIREAIGYIGRLGPAVLTWASSKKASDDITKFLQWFSQNGPVVGQFLKSIGAALAALAPGLAAGGTAELQALTTFFNFVAKLPPGLAKPLAEVAGALLILNKLGVVSVGFKLLGLGGAGGAASAAGTAAGGAAAGGLWSKILPGVRLVGGALVAAVIIDTALKATSSGKGKNWLDNPFGQGTFTDPKTGKQAGSPSWLTSWSTAFSGSIVGKIVGLFHHASASIEADFAAQGKAAVSAQADVGVLTQAITHNGNASGEAHTARANLIADMVKAGVNAGTAQTDVMNYSNAVQANGAKSTQAAAARGKLISDILAASKNAAQGQRDLATFTNAVQANGSKSDAARSARAKLIADLEKSGLSAHDATGLVNGLQTSIDRLHGKTVQIHMNGQGLYTISGSVIAASQGRGGSGNAAGGLAAGGFISGGTPGRDSVIAALMPGEVVVPVRMVKAGAVDHLRGQLPGFASGGQVSGNLTPGFVSGMYSSFQNQMTGSMVGAMRTSLKTAEAAAIAAAKAAQASFGPGSGALGGDARANKVLALSMFPWPSSMFGAFDYLEMREAGYNRFARNPSSGAYGIPQALPPTKMPFAAQAAGGSHAGPQLSWMYGYIHDRYGNPVNAANHERVFNWYAKGGLVPGYASGGTVARQGAAWLNAWKSRHGGGFGAAWGPTVLNQQIPEMAAAMRRAQTLAGARGLSPGQHRFWAAAALDEKKRLGVLGKELTTERAWRYQLGLNELGLDKEIRAAGSLPSLARNVTGWKAQMGRDKATIAGISKMLGYSDAYIKAHPAAIPPVTGVQATHSYGGDVADNLGVILSAALGPFTGAARGGMVFDSGGTLRPGFNPVWNNTGRPESLVPARGGGGVHLHLTVNGPVGSQQQLEDWFIRTANKTAQHGRLTQAVKAASR